MPPVSAASSTSPSSPTWSPEPGTPAGLTHAQGGENLVEVAQRVGVDASALRRANPDLPNPDHLLPGQALNLPAAGQDDAGLPAGAGVAGALGREGAVQGQMHKAYEAGRTAPQQAFDGKVYRAVSESYTATAYDHTYGNAPNRYRGATERLVYNSPDMASTVQEGRPYAPPGKPPLAGLAVVEGHYTATPDAEGKGGVADLHEGLRRTGLSSEALTAPKGPQQSGLLYRLTGEHPYTLGQQAVKGAADAGASGVRAPSATGAKEQINIIPRNTDPAQLRPERVYLFDEHGTVRAERPATEVKPMPANDKPPVDGPYNKRAGERADPGAANEGAAKPIEKPGMAHTLQRASGALEGHPRANSGRYGAVGGAVVSLGQDAVNAARGGRFDAVDTATRAGTQAGIGYGAARATDALAPKVLGGLKGAGGIVAGVIEGVASTGTNAQAYRRGEISAARASANIAVDTGTAVGAGVAGAAVGAAVGSIVPVAGTAVGAVAGFAAGTLTYVGARALGEASGLLDRAKDKLTEQLGGLEKPLGKALDTVGAGLDQAKDWGGRAWNAVKPW